MQKTVNCCVLADVKYSSREFNVSHNRNPAEGVCTSPKGDLCEKRAVATESSLEVVMMSV